MSRPENERDGKCICDYSPNTEGPLEECPFHGRPYAYWIERGDRLAAERDALLAKFEALADRWADDAGIEGYINLGEAEDAIRAVIKEARA